ncbi:MAG: tRNA lysidine(34) synthetase TilS [Dehalococcoidia bacterium]|nr:tRNA lysidine(34) synthetase TilS [Dehalococcoidia bacterium]
MKRKSLTDRRVLSFIGRHSLISSGDTLVAGVSGGADSVCLLHILVGLRSQSDIRIHIAHLNHMLRGKESDADARFVASLAQRFAVPITVESVDVAAYRQEHKLSMEEAAREVRYGFFARVVDAVGACGVMVGHTSDDQLETVLMHLVRGSGIDGMRGMLPLTVWKSLNGDCEVSVRRPLLEISHDEAVIYCRDNELDIREDLSNTSPHYLRNRIRCELLPLLRNYNPGFERSLLRTASLVCDDIDFLDESMLDIWDEVVSCRDEVYVLSIAGMYSQHPVLRRRVFREVLRRLLGSLKDIEWRHIDDLVEALSLSAGKTLSLPRGLTFLMGYGECIIGRNLDAMCPLPPLEGEYRLNIPGETVIPGWCIGAEILSCETTLEEGSAACMDVNVTGRELTVRSRGDGDEFQPLGMPQSKKLQDFMVDVKIPRTWRHKVPLVCSAEHIVWVVGWRIDERVKVSSETTEVLCLKFELLNA